MMVPFHFALMMQQWGWLLRSVNPWDKGSSGDVKNSDRPCLTHEWILQFAKPFWMKNGAIGRTMCNTKPRSESVYRYRGTGNSKHGAKFPLPLALELVNSFPQGAKLIDPYMGTGTTGIACYRTGREFIGIELDATLAEQEIRDEIYNPQLSLPGVLGVSA
jgi:site-specific DNA-methyltransferase (adenine-specific)